MDKKTISSTFNHNVFDLIKQLIEWIPSEPKLKDYHSQLDLVRKANPKMINKTLHQYLLLPYNQVIQESNFDKFIKTLLESDMYLNNKKDYEELVEQLLKPIMVLSDEQKNDIMRRFLKLLQLSFMLNEGK